METNVKAVINLMQTLGVSLDDLKRALSSNSEPQGKIEFRRASNGRSYAVLGHEVLGVLIDSQTYGRFVIALRRYGENIPYDRALREVSKLPSVAGKKWIIPSDGYLRAAFGSRDDVSSVNYVIDELHGHQVGSRPMLSSTSQANRPARWEVRLILPLD